ncbi:MAG: hypothetical protein QM723_06650 [Myxococcaceae bacterium]
MQDIAFVNQVLERCDSLKAAKLWDSEPKLSPRRWLGNFEEKDRVLAAAILSQLTYFSDLATETMFASALFLLQHRRFDPSSELQRARLDFYQRLEAALFTPVEGETPNPTDSGNFFCRKAREILGIDESKIRDPKEALEGLGPGDTLYLLDDFIGTGEQVVKMWARDYADSSPKSLKEAVGISGIEVAVVCAVATRGGAERITGSTGMPVFAEQLIDDRYKIQSLPDMAELPQHQDLRSKVADLLRRVSPRLDLSAKPFLQGDQRAFGFGEQGLSLIFSHGAPDGSLPVLWAPASKDWKPLFVASP